jgi:hypothetical protein
MGLTLEQLDHQMAGRADAGGAERVFLRVFADEIEKIFQVIGRHARRRRDDQRAGGDQRHRREILHHVERHAFVQKRADDVERRGEQQRVAIRIGLGDHIGADIARGAAGAVFDNEMRPDGLVELIDDDARHAVHGTARRERYDHSDGASGIVLC